MTPAQAAWIEEHHAKLRMLASKEVADKVKAQALAAGEDAAQWAQSMPTVLNSWAWWDAVSGRFEQATREAMAGRDPLGATPVHHRWGVPLSAEQARQVDDATARAYAAGVPFAASGMRDVLQRFVPPREETRPSIDEVRRALAAITASTPTTRPTGAPPHPPASRARAGPAARAQRSR